QEKKEARWRELENERRQQELAKQQASTLSADEQATGSNHIQCKRCNRPNTVIVHNGKNWCGWCGKWADEVGVSPYPRRQQPEMNTSMPVRATQTSSELVEFRSVTNPPSKQPNAPSLARCDRCKRFGTVIEHEGRSWCSWCSRFITQ